MDNLLQRPLVAMLAPPLSVAMLLAVLGPFGTFTTLDLPTRLLFWGLIVPLNWLQTEPTVRWLTDRVPGVLAPVLASLLSAVPATAEVAVLLHWLLPDQPAPIGPLYLWVAVLTVAISVPMWLLKPQRPAAAEAATPPVDIAFLRRIPPRLGRDILCLGMEDHYLRVYTPLGDDLILLRLKDAEAELAGLDGLRVHRSWWVARRAVAAVRRDGDRLMLDLVNGMSVPVSRANVAAVKAAGWMDRTP